MTWHKENDYSLQGLLHNRSLSTLQHIMRHAERLLAIDAILADYLPGNLAPHCRAMQVTPTQLIIAVDSAAWLTRMNYLKPQLLSTLRTHPQFNYLQELHFRIRTLPNPLPQHTTTADSQPQPLSTATVQLIQHTAENISDPDLKKALLRLARS